MMISMIYIFFAAGLFLAIVAWVGFGLVKNSAFRVLLRTSFISIFVTPSIIIGHGFVPAPALLVMIFEGHFLIALIPMLAVWFISLSVVLLIPRARQSKTTWPLDYLAILSDPAIIKLPIYGFILSLILMGSNELISDYWYLGVLLLVGGVVLNFSLSLHSYERSHRGRFFLPLLLAAPVAATGMFHFAVLWYIPGLAGVLVAEGKRQKAFWLGAAISITLFVGALNRIYSAIKYKDVPHVTIQGGVKLAAITAAFLLCLSILFSVLAWSSKFKQKPNGVD